MPKRKFGRKWAKRRAKKRGLLHWKKSRKLSEESPNIPKYKKKLKRIRLGRGR